MITVKDILNSGDYSNELKESLKDHNPTHIVALLRHTDGNSPTLCTYEPRECDLKYLRLQELLDKMKNGNADLTYDEQKEADEIMEFLGYNREWSAPSGFNRGKINENIITLDLSNICK